MTPEAMDEPVTEIQVAPPVPLGVMALELVVVAALFVLAPSGLVAAFAAAGALLLLFLQSRPARLALKREALVWSWAGVQRSFPLADVAGARAVEEERDRALELLSGAGAQRLRVLSEPEVLEAFVAAIERRRAGAPSSHASLVAALARGDRDDATWAADVQRLVSTGGFRRRRVAIDDLVAVALDPGSPLDARGAAIVAAYPHADERDRERLRFVGEDTAVDALAHLVDEVLAAEEADAGEGLRQALRALAPERRG